MTKRTRTSSTKTDKKNAKRNAKKIKTRKQTERNTKKNVPKTKKKPEKITQKAGENIPKTKKRSVKLKPKGGGNDELKKMFFLLHKYALLEGLRYVSSSYRKVSISIDRARNTITSGKEASRLKGIGKKSAELIDEYLETGKMGLLEKWKDEWGELEDQPAHQPTEIRPIKVSAEDKKKLQAAKIRVSKLTVPELKDALRRNRQRVSGPKHDLIERVTDGEVFGIIPQCTICGGGRLRFQKGIYTCPGYMDDTSYVHCDFRSSTITREPWQS